jgi:transketolase
MEEIAIVRSIPNMKMIVPCDYWETRKATVAAADDPHPNYLRFGREPVPVVTGPESPFEMGKANVLREGNDLALIACGVMVYEALVAAEELAGRGVQARVINMHTIKPLDVDAIERAARQCGAIVTAEEHQVNGGLGGAVAEAVVRLHPVPMELVAVHDRFGRSGKQDELMAEFGIKSPDILKAAERALARKRTR